MKQLELFPYLIDQKVLDYYRIVLREIKLLDKARLNSHKLLDEFGQMSRQAKKDREEYSIPDSIDDIRDFKFRRFTMKFHQDKHLDDIYDNLVKWTIRKKLLEKKVNYSPRIEL